MQGVSKPVPRSEPHDRDGEIHTWVLHKLRPSQGLGVPTWPVTVMDCRPTCGRRDRASDPRHSACRRNAAAPLRDRPGLPQRLAAGRTQLPARKQHSHRISPAGRSVGPSGPACNSVSESCPRSRRLLTYLPHDIEIQLSLMLRGWPRGRVLWSLRAAGAGSGGEGGSVHQTASARAGQTVRSQRSRIELLTDAGAARNAADGALLGLRRGLRASVLPVPRLRSIGPAFVFFRQGGEPLDHLRIGDGSSQAACTSGLRRAIGSSRLPCEFQAGCGVLRSRTCVIRPPFSAGSGGVATARGRDRRERPTTEPPAFLAAASRASEGDLALRVGVLPGAYGHRPRTAAGAFFQEDLGFDHRDGSFEAGSVVRTAWTCTGSRLGALPREPAGATVLDRQIHS